MREIGGYIEFEHYHGEMLHKNAIALNCGRNCLAYLFRSRGIKKLKIPYFICNSIYDICDREGVEKDFYHIDQSFKPVGNMTLESGEWLYLVNLYGQLSNEEIQEYVEKYGRVIVDQANDYFAEPLVGVDTFYTCRKWFGVADGAFLYTDSPLFENFPMDESYKRMEFLLGRFERTASEFYSGYSENNKFFAYQPIKRMSKLTENLLHAVDYEAVENRRISNFKHVHDLLGSINQLKINVASFMYPLMIDNGAAIRNKLQEKKIYIPLLWPTVFNVADPEDLEYKMAENILPLPIDQRYDEDDIAYMINTIMNIINKRDKQ